MGRMVGRQNAFPFPVFDRRITGMAIPSAPKFTKWPFLLADVLLVALGSLLAWTAKWPLQPATVLGVVFCFGLGCYLLTLPFIREHGAAVKLWEQSNLADAAQQLDQWVTVANRVSASTGQWEMVQATAQKTQQATAELVDRIHSESRAFGEFLQRADLQEKQVLRFELEKVRREESEMLQVLVHTLDHVYALQQAGSRSGQPQLAQQLQNFRSACLETARRIGLIAYEATPGELFNPQSHQNTEGQEPPEGSLIAATVASGYTFQGQAVRRILVAVQPPPSTAEASISSPALPVSG